MATSVSQWTTPSTRPEHIEQLISGVDRYNPQNLTVLTEYLEQQMQNGEYDCLANLAILKL
jgi:translation initiation factor 3 subunit K